MEPAMIGSYILLAILGMFVAMVGTLVGAGGGFILTPILALTLPLESADRITALSMAMIFFNAASGSIAYARMRRIDFTSGWYFIVAALPGAFAGAALTHYVARQTFDRVLGATLIIIALYLLKKVWRKAEAPSSAAAKGDEKFTPTSRSRWIGSAISSVVGLISSLLGIGGGIIHVPALVYVLGYPIHIATATSHFVLACTSFAAVAVHVASGSYEGNYEIAGVLAFGAVIGAQLGARLARKINGPIIVVGLAVALVMVGIRIVYGSLH